jgi:twitching motility protein PilT
MNLDELLRVAASNKASDLHLKVGNYPHLRIDGELYPMTRFPRVSPEEMTEMAFFLMTDHHKERFEQKRDIDLAYGIEGVGRFRINVFQQRGSLGMAVRLIPNVILRMDELHLPPVIGKLCDERRGLVLVTGSTGCGKTTTLAAMIDYINSTRTDHIITIEDPIEFLHRDAKGFVHQREVEVDTPSFGLALRAALRQDPDVILVGEMRDMETILIALQAAETGHLVFSTLHTLDATETVQRMISAFPLSDQMQIRLQVASTLRGIICQRLVRKSDGVGRVPAAEVMVTTEYIRACIVDGEKTNLIRSAIASGTSQYSMQTFDQSLYDLYSQKLIALEEALLQASNPADFKLRVAGIRGTTDVAGEEMGQAHKVDRFVRRGSQ